MAILLPVKRYDPRTTRTYAEIDLRKLAGNIVAIHTAYLAGSRGRDAMMAIVKADAYGHGSVAVARVCAACGVEHFGVATVEEGLTLRKAGIRGDIYLLTSFVPDEAEAVVRGDIIPLLSSPDHYAALADAARYAPLPARAFLVVDTGMGREGMLPDTARELWRRALGDPAVRFVGISSHLACADETDADGTEATRAQSETFATFVRSVANTFPAREDGRGNPGIWLSLCNSPGTVRRADWEPFPTELPGVRGVLYRAGLLLYGIEPHRGAFTDMPEVQQILAWRAKVQLVRSLPSGATVGYGKTHTLTRDSRIATLAVGYADGYPRRYSNRGTILLRGQRFPIVGRVSMDQMQVDVTDATSPIAIGEIATLLGTDTDESIPTLTFAEEIDATAHEPSCALTNRVSRLYVNIPNKA